ncbi:hypothetical protein FAZ15_05560 [Sphingobacterium olei]|uniref:Methylamine utilisation protein MauE domain-containing protein n=1 Tax=Sphingobacterium olei TaxID=2571155 RepID=A0A4U0P419_9SPHI|nr:MauE/DoxX family redox-associated membrane protein [Sphingobacterium olei]TJZ61979.1 hypothetical protein FAZ15_05560 [Sphingobacterium olei]
MKTRKRHIIGYSLQIFLLIFWLYVALDKLWGLKAFHISLLRQPFPNWWADILYWNLPLFELGIALLFVFASSSRGKNDRRDLLNKQRLLPRFAHRNDVVFNPYLLSALLLLIFTIYIALGVAGLYAKKPCGCASVFSGLSWEWHLLVNIVLLGLSTLGWYLSGPTNPIDTAIRYKKSIKLFCTFLLFVSIPVYHIVLVVHKRFPRKFAPFPGRPVWV